MESSKNTTEGVAQATGTPSTATVVGLYMAYQLRTNSAWAMKALVRVWSFQTESERADKLTSAKNGVGFNGVDAPFLSSLAEQVAQGRRLSDKQVKCLHRAMPKYGMQVYSAASAEQQAIIAQQAKAFWERERLAVCVPVPVPVAPAPAPEAPVAEVAPEAAPAKAKKAKAKKAA